MSNPSEYGSRYWCVTGDGDPLFLHADFIEVNQHGDLIAYGGYRKEGFLPEEKTMVYAVAAKAWHTCFAASHIDGSPVAAEDF